MGALRAALLGTASGLLFGLVSALTKGAVEVFQDDGLGVLANWHLYALIAVGFAGMTITQLSLQAGILPPAVATSSIFNPAASVVLGLTLFDEQVHHGTASRIGAAWRWWPCSAGLPPWRSGGASRLTRGVRD